MMNKSFISTSRFFIEKNFPKSIFSLIRRIYKNLNYFFEFVLCILNYIFLFIPNFYLKRKNIFIFCFKRFGIGDKLMITAALEAYKKEGRVIFICSGDEIYKNLGIEIKNIKKTFFSKMLILFLTTSVHSNIVGSFGNYLKYSKINGDASLVERIFHKRKDVLRKLDKYPKPIVKFSEGEIKKYSKKYSKLLKSNYGIVMSGSYLNGHPTTKNIDKEKIQNAIDSVKLDWVQVGMKDEPELKNIINLRGTSLRETFFLISKSKLVLCIEGMLTHVSAAFNTPCVSIYTGFHNPAISKYKNVFPVQPNPLPFCAYCWDHVCKKTGNSNALCEKDIASKEIIKVIERALKKGE